MDSEEPADGSSSPSVNPRIRSVTEEGGIAGVVRVITSDGSSFLFFRDDVSGGDLVSGQEISPDYFNLLRVAHEKRDIFLRGLSLLGHTSQSRATLHRKLVQRDFPVSLIDSALDRLERFGFLDDERFATNWIISRLRRSPEAPMLLVQGLVQRGVARDLAQAVVRSEVDSALQADSLRRAYEKLVRTKRDRVKLIRSLVAKGFALSDVLRIVGRESDNDDTCED